MIMSAAPLEQHSFIIVAKMLNLVKIVALLGSISA